jgi:hypothetical protein
MLLLAVLYSRLARLWEVLYSSIGFKRDEPIYDDRSSFSPAYIYSLGSSLTTCKRPLIEDICVYSVFSSSSLLFNLTLDGPRWVWEKPASPLPPLSRVLSSGSLWLRGLRWLRFVPVRSLITDWSMSVNKSSAILSARDSLTLARCACSGLLLSD